MRITFRQESIINNIPCCNTLVDVGCDHGIISYQALKRGISKKAICTDISKPSLEKAKRLIESEYDNCEFIVADGIPENIKYDYCVIAGMGGLEIIRIINNGKPENVLTQPMNNIIAFREKVVEMGYKIIYDKLIFDKKYYNIIKLEKGEDSLSIKEKLFGRTNIVDMDETFIKFLKEEKKKFAKIIVDIKNDEERKKQLEEIINNIEEVLK